jgi:hypothetical protein
MSSFYILKKSEWWGTHPIDFNGHSKLENVFREKLFFNSGSGKEIDKNKIIYFYQSINPYPANMENMVKS